MNSSNEKKSGSPLGKQAQRREAGVASVVMVFASVGIGWGAPPQVNSVEWYSSHVEAREAELERCNGPSEFESRNHDQNCINASKAKQIREGLVRTDGSFIHPKNHGRQAATIQVIHPATIETRN